MSSKARRRGFRSFFHGGFECSTHVLRSGRRLDVVGATRHEEFALADYARLRHVGIATARDGVRWHLIETEPGRYDFETARHSIRAALAADVEVIWDLVHFGWPDHVDPLAPSFPDRLADFASAFARVLRTEGVAEAGIVPVNEISFLSFAGGEAGFFNPFLHGRGPSLKEQLVRGALAASLAARSEFPGLRLVATDPLIHVAYRGSQPGDAEPAAASRDSQYESIDMLTGRHRPDLGGSPDRVDVVGLNFYVHNQWYFPGGHGSVIRPSNPDYRPLRDILNEAYARHRKPLFIAETGIEDSARPLWLRYVMREVRAAMRSAVEMLGVCLYPIVNHPGWDDDRHCHNGLWDYANGSGERVAYGPLLTELVRQQGLMDRFLSDDDFIDDESLALEGLDEVAGDIAEITDKVREA